MKIDCSKTINFLKEMDRLCETHVKDCRDCPINIDERPQKMGCEEFMYKYPEEIVEIVQKWSDEHPQKTRLEDLLEKYPNAIINELGISPICVKSLGYTTVCIGICRDCWNMPV